MHADIYIKLFHIKVATGPFVFRRSGLTMATELDLTNLSAEWEREEVIRDHLREEGAVLFDKDQCSESVKTCSESVANAVLVVLALRMAGTKGMPQPQVIPLREELEKLYKRCGAQVDDKIIYEDSWMIRKLCCFLKMKTRKKHVSTAPCFISKPKVSRFLVL